MQFGAFIGPRANDIAGVRERVLAAERSGFDFISIQDHPYVPAYLDTFSLIANLAAASTVSRPRSGPGTEAVRTTAEHWARIVAEFAVEERFDAVNFVL